LFVMMNKEVEILFLIITGFA